MLGELNTTTVFFATIEAGMQAKVDELFEADWAEARARVGDDACGTDLLRNDTQRWHDALMSLVRQGIGADPVTTNAVTNIVGPMRSIGQGTRRVPADL